MKTLKSDVVRTLNHTKYISLCELENNEKRGSVNYVVISNGNQTGLPTFERAERYYNQLKADVL